MVTLLGLRDCVTWARCETRQSERPWKKNSSCCTPLLRGSRFLGCAIVQLWKNMCHQKQMVRRHIIICSPPRCVAGTPSAACQERQCCTTQVHYQIKHMGETVMLHVLTSLMRCWYSFSCLLSGNVMPHSCMGEANAADSSQLNMCSPP